MRMQGGCVSAERVRMAERMRTQSEACAMLGSPLYERLLVAVTADVERGGPCWDVLRTTVEDPPGSARALRFMGAVHRLVLEGSAAELSAFYPSVGGRVADGVEEAFLAAVATHCARLVDSVHDPVQTNEVGRCAALIGGFLEIARSTRLPLRVLELGASAGLNLRWDRYRYEARGATWGDPGSPVRLCTYNSDRPLPFEVSGRVVERAGCDRAPLDPTTEQGATTLTSYVWPDQPHRLRLLRSALTVAAEFPVAIRREPAGTWLEARLAEERSGLATVVFHSIVLQYLPPEERDRVRELLAAAGDRATATAPLAWLRMEPAGPLTHVHLTQWPGGRERLVATAGYHGTGVRWLL